MIGPENRMFSLVLSPPGRTPLESEGESPPRYRFINKATLLRVNECLMLEEGLQGGELQKPGNIGVMRTPL